MRRHVWEQFPNPDGFFSHGHVPSPGDEVVSADGVSDWICFRCDSSIWSVSEPVTADRGNGPVLVATLYVHVEPASGEARTAGVLTEVVPVVSACCDEMLRQAEVEEVLES